MGRLSRFVFINLSVIPTSTCVMFMTYDDIILCGWYYIQKISKVEHYSWSNQWLNSAKFHISDWTFGTMLKGIKTYPWFCKIYFFWILTSNQYIFLLVPTCGRCIFFKIFHSIRFSLISHTHKIMLLFYLFF